MSGITVLNNGVNPASTTSTAPSYPFELENAVALQDSLVFTSTMPGASADYFKYVYESTISKTEQINQPTLLDFKLAARKDDASFVKLTRGSYISIRTQTYGLWFSGYITNEPEYQYIGKDPATKQPVWGYVYEATSDEYLLNMKPLGIMPPFVNTTMGAILTTLVNRLAPGMYDTTGIQSGNTIARFVVDPSKKFSDIAKEFADASNYRFSALAMRLDFRPIDQVPQTITIDGNDKHFTPSRFTLKPRLDDTVINDAIVIGDIEAQNYINEYFVGDGATARFPLISSVFGADSSVLLDDDFSGSTIDTNKWTVYDTVNNWIQPYNGFLNALGGNNDNAYNVYVTSASLIPLEGNLRFTCGEYDFVSTSDGVIASVWTGNPVASLAGCFFGIKATKSGSNTILNPIWNGTIDGTQSLTVNYAHRYIIRTTASFRRVFRIGQTYSYISQSGVVGTVGPSDTFTDVCDLQTLIVEVDPSNANIVSTTNWSGTISNVAATTVFGNYVPMVLNDLHCTVTGITISTPMQAFLEIEAKGTNTWVTKLIGPNEIDSMDGTAPMATITDANQGAITRSSFLGSLQYNPGQAALQFFKDSVNLTTTVPQVGDLVHLAYRRAGAAIGRVQNLTSIASEATAFGDSGVRSVTRLDLDPKPRTTAEAEAAASALVQDVGYQHYEGTYLQPSGYSFNAEPHAGSILKFQNIPSLPSTLQAEVITEIVTTMFLLGGELFEHNITFGKIDQMARVVKNFAKQKDVFLPQDTAEIPNAVSTAALPTLVVDNVIAPSLVSWDANNFNFNTNQAPPTGGGFEVRYTDDSWGADDAKNLIVRTTSQTFSVPRTARGKICFVKAYDSRNKIIYSEDMTNAAWTKSGSATVVNATGSNPNGDLSNISKVTIGSNAGFVYQQTSTPAASQQAIFTVSLNGTAGKNVSISLKDGAGTLLLAQTVTLTGAWQRVSVTGTFGSGASGNIRCYVTNTSGGSLTFQMTDASMELGSTETAYFKTMSTPYGAMSRWGSGLHVALPLIPPSPTGTVDYTDPVNPKISVTLPVLLADVWGVEVRASDNTTVIYKSDLSAAAFNIVVTAAGNASRSLSYYLYTYNLLGEYSTAYNLTATIPTPTVNTVDVNEETMLLEWTATNAKNFRVEIDRVSNAFASESVNTSTTDLFFQLSPQDFFNQRWFKVTAYDALGDGVSLQTTHTYTPTVVDEFNNNEVQSVLPPAGPNTGPTVPTQFQNYTGQYVGLSWEQYNQNQP